MIISVPYTDSHTARETNLAWVNVNCYARGSATPHGTTGTSSYLGPPGLSLRVSGVVSSPEKVRYFLLACLPALARNEC